MKIAWARELVAGERSWLVTPDLHLVPKDSVEAAPSVLRRSVWYTTMPAFPFAITLRDTVALAGQEAEWPATSLVPLAAGAFRGGVELASKAGQRAARTADGAWIASADIAVFGRRTRPAEVAANEKWLHVRINDGSLVAYEGDRPVFAAVVSPGMHGANPDGAYRTPTGRFRISAKHITSDMGGTVGQGSWRSRAVPWVAYFQDGYALHGAWWHDAFGRPRSHGCVNLTPGDARALFQWLEPSLPDGWYAVRSQPGHEGTVVLITP
ncbi:MAG TPA: L,D-transpeptidase [Gemmatimonadales bacterium]|nr:L,D-transpeptidase [Gemmatimonadales bacterium]